MLRIQELLALRFSIIFGVSSVLPSSTITHKTGFTFCSVTDLEASGRFSSSFLAGVISRYLPFNSVFIFPPPVNFFPACYPGPSSGTILQRLFV